MKRFSLLLCLLLCLSLLAGCSAASSVAPAKLSPTEQTLANLLSLHTALYDVKLSKDVRSVHINLYRLQDGQWARCTGGGMPVRDAEQRIILAIDPDSGKVKLTDGYSTVTFTDDPLQLPERSVGAVRMDDPRTLPWDQEIPLYLYVESSADRIAFSASDFYHPEKLAHHERVYALTVMVSQQDVQ